MNKKNSASRINNLFGAVWLCLVAFLLSVSLFIAGCALSEAPPAALLSQTPPVSASPSVPAVTEVPPATTTAPAPVSIPAPIAPKPTTLAPTPRQINTATPLSDMTAADNYKGEDGGLYGRGLNTPPTGHREAALKALAEIKPVDAGGSQSPEGKIVLVSIGMSNTTQEFSTFKKLADADPDKSTNLRIVDGAQGGQTAQIWATQEKPWQVLEQRLSAAGVTPQQVQIIWAKHANAQPTKAFPIEAKALQEQLGMIVRRIKERYPNVKIVYLSSRTYGGYATTALNPEPHAFESAFAVRRLIQSQIDGNPDLNYDPNIAPAVSPLLLWGPYLWADGLNARNDGLIWERTDFTQTDGTHPSDGGRAKVARLLLDFFKTNELAHLWFIRSR